MKFRESQRRFREIQGRFSRSQILFGGHQLHFIRSQKVSEGFQGALGAFQMVSGEVSVGLKGVSRGPRGFQEVL